MEFSKWLSIIKILAAQAVPYLTFQFFFYVPQFVQLPFGLYMYQTLFGSPTRFFFFNALYNMFCSWAFFDFGFSPNTSPYDPTLYSPQNMAATDQLLAVGAKASLEGEGLISYPVGMTLLPPNPILIEPSTLQNELSIQRMSSMDWFELVGVIKKLPYLPTVCDTFATTGENGEITGRVGVSSIKLSELARSQAVLHYEAAKGFSMQSFNFSSTLNLNLAFTNNPHYPLFPLTSPIDTSAGRSDLQSVYLGQYLGDRLNLEDGRCVMLFFNNKFDRTPHDFDIIELKSCNTRAHSLLSVFAQRRNHPETGMDMFYYNHGYLGIIEYWPRNSYAQFNYYEIDDSFAFDFETPGHISRSCVEEYRRDVQDQVLSKELGISSGSFEPPLVCSAHKNHISNALWLIVDYYNEATRQGISYSEQGSRLHMNDLAQMLNKGPVSLFIPEYFHREYTQCQLVDMAPHGCHTLQQWQHVTEVINELPDGFGGNLSSSSSDFDLENEYYESEFEPDLINKNKERIK